MDSQRLVNGIDPRVIMSQIHPHDESLTICAIFAIYLKILCFFITDVSPDGFIAKKTIESTVSSQFRTVKFQSASWLKVLVQKYNHILKATSKRFYVLPYVTIESEQDKVTEACTNFTNQCTEHASVEQVVNETKASGLDQRIASSDSCTNQSMDENTKLAINTSPAAVPKQTAPVTRTPATVRKVNSERVLLLGGGGQLDLDQLPTSDADCTREMLAACARRIHELGQRKRKLEEASDEITSAGKAVKLQSRFHAIPHKKKIVNGLQREIKAQKFQDSHKDMEVKFTDVMSEDEVVQPPFDLLVCLRIVPQNNILNMIANLAESSDPKPCVCSSALPCLFCLCHT
jgi:hypothetical protein